MDGLVGFPYNRKAAIGPLGHFAISMEFEGTLLGSFGDPFGTPFGTKRGAKMGAKRGLKRGALLEPVLDPPRSGGLGQMAKTCSATYGTDLISYVL